VINKNDERIPAEQKADYEKILALKSGETYTTATYEYRFYMTLKKDGATGIAYQATPVAGSETNLPDQYGAIMVRDDNYYVLKFSSGEDTRAFWRKQYDMTQVVYSFRFLTESEQVK
jgi:hypothetical protein